MFDGASLIRPQPHKEHFPQCMSLYQNNCHASIKWHVNRKPSALPHNDRLYGKFNKPLSVCCPHALSLPIEKYLFGLWHVQNYEPSLFMSPSLFFTPHPAQPPTQFTSWLIASVPPPFLVLSSSSPPFCCKGQTWALAIQPLKPRASKWGASDLDLL